MGSGWACVMAAGWWLSGSAPAVAPASEDWTWRAAVTDGAFAAEDLDDRAWPELHLPAPDGVAGGSGYLWLRARVPVPAALREARPVLTVGRVQGAAEVYLNGSLVGFFGSFPPDYVPNDAQLKWTLLPPGLLKQDGDNLVALRFYKPGAAPVLAAPVRVERFQDVWLRAKVLDLLNADLFLAFTVVALVLAAAYLLQFLRRASERPYLMFSVANAGVAAYFLEMTTLVDPVRSAALVAVAKAGMLVFVTAMVLLFLEYFHLHNRRGLRLGLMVGAGAGILVLGGSATDPGRVLAVFNVLLLPIQLLLVFTLYLVFRAAAQGQQDARPVAVGAVLAFAAAMHDIVYQVSGVLPVAWLQGIGIFAIGLAVHLSFSLRANREQEELSRHLERHARTSRQLKETVAHVGAVTAVVAGASRTLAGTARDVAGTTHTLRDQAAGISLAVRLQQAATEGVQERLGELGERARHSAALAGEHRQGLTHAVEQVARVGEFLQQTERTLRDVAGSAQRIGGHTEAMEQRSLNAAQTLDALGGASAKVEEVVAEAARTAGDVIRRAAEGGHAARHAAVGMASAASSFQAVAKMVRGLGEQVEAVGGVVAMIQDVSQRTRLLSLNASILSSQAGEAGRGFAVVAGEIQVLSDRTSQSTQEIAAILAALTQGRDEVLTSVQGGLRAVETGQELAGRAGEAMKRIEELTRLHHALVDSLAVVASTQAAGTRDVRDATNAQDAGAREIQAVSGAQRQAVEFLASQLATVAQTLQDIRNVIHAEAASSAQVVDLVHSVAAVVESTRTSTGQLRQSGEHIVQDAALIRDAAAQAVVRMRDVEVLVQDLDAQVERLRAVAPRSPSVA